MAGSRRSGVAEGPVRSFDGFARSQLAELQRARILTAMIDECFERGVAGVSVAHVVARSGVSRRTFYEAFTDREDCFLAAFEQALSLARERVLEASGACGSWRERIRMGLTALLSLLEEEPRLGRVLLCESVAGGSRVLRRRAEMIEQVARAVDEGRLQSKGAGELSPLTAEGIVGGTLAVIQARLLTQSAARSAHLRPLLELVNPLMSTIVLPYLGPAAARRELKSPVATSTAGAVNGVLLADPFKAAGMRLTYRTVRVLMAIADHDGASNRLIAESAGIADQGQVSKLLARLQRFGLLTNNAAGGSGKGEPNEWALTPTGEKLTRSISAHTNTNEARLAS